MLNLNESSTKPWVIIGDLSELTSSKEKLANNNGNSTQYSKFKNI